MADNMIKFLRGNVASLPQNATAGAVYFTKDEGLYLGLEDGTYHRYGDFITVANVAALPEAGAHETCMYYCIEENILAKWDGSAWVQINKQKTLAELGGVAKSVYDAKMALLEQADTDNATAISDLEAYVGTIPEGATATNVVAYVQEKTAGIATSENLQELTTRVATAEGEIDDLQSAIGEGGSVTNAIAAAKKAGDDAQADVDALETVVGEYKTANDAALAGVKTTAEQGVADAATAKAAADAAAELAGTKATMDEVNDAIAGAGHAVKTEVDKAISDLDAAYKAADVTLQANIDKKADQTVVDAITADYLKADDKTELAGLITAEENVRKAADEALDARLLEVETFFATAEGETLNDALDTLVEIQNYITSDGTAADEMVKDIAANAEAIAANADAIEQEAKDRAAADQALSDRIDAIHAHDNKTVLDGISAEKVAAWDAAQANIIETVKVNGVALTPDSSKAVDVTVPTGALASKDKVAKADLDSALVDELNAKAVAADVTTALAGKVDKVEGKSLVSDTEITKLAGVSAGANKVEASANNGSIKIDGVETVVYTHPAAHAISEVTGLEDALAAKLEADDIANKADKATTLAGYGITDAYTKTEVEAMLTWGSF